jgi:chitinase
VGGWTLSTNFPVIAADPVKRTKFVTACLTLVEDLGLDGIDIDWEYPKSKQEGEDFYQLLKELRAAFTLMQKQKADTVPYLMTIACPCGSANYSLMPIGKFAQVLNYFNLMAYDFAGAWDSVTGHQAKLYGAEPSCERAVKDYIAMGAKPSQLILGIPLYGRSFLNTQPTVPAPFSGVGHGSWEPGVYDYKTLPLAASTVSVDQKLGASWCYEPTAKELVSYDNPDVVNMKCKWAGTMGLGGLMVWELSGDYKIDHPASILKIFQAWAKGSGGLDATANHLKYPKSKYDNMRKGFDLDE